MLRISCSEMSTAWSLVSARMLNMPTLKKIRMTISILRVLSTPCLVVNSLIAVTMKAIEEWARLAADPFSVPFHNYYDQSCIIGGQPAGDFVFFFFFAFSALLERSDRWVTLFSPFVVLQLSYSRTFPRSFIADITRRRKRAKSCSCRISKDTGSLTQKWPGEFRKQPYDLQIRIY